MKGVEEASQQPVLLFINDADEMERNLEKAAKPTELQKKIKGIKCV